MFYGWVRFGLVWFGLFSSFYPLSDCDCSSIPQSLSVPVWLELRCLYEFISYHTIVPFLLPFPLVSWSRFAMLVASVVLYTSFWSGESVMVIINVEAYILPIIYVEIEDMQTYQLHV